MAKAKQVKTVESVQESTPFVMKMVKPRNEKQKYYLDLLNDPSNNLIIATGLAGTSKSWLASYVAARKLHNGEIDKIYIVRPAVSCSQSMGYFGGDILTKCKNWVMPIYDALEEFLGKEKLEELILLGKVEPIPLEVIKGRTLKNCFAIVDESEDCTFSEFKKCSTRIGENATMVFSGDLCQVDLKNGSGLQQAVNLLTEHPDLFDWKHVDFDKIGEVVRSESVRKTISGFRKLGIM